MEDLWRRRSGGNGRGRRNELQGHSPIHPHQHHVVMHELSIAVQIVEIAEDELVRHGGDRVRSIHVQLGALSGVAKEALQFSFGMACEGTTAEGANLVIEDAAGHELDVVRMEIEP